MRKELLELLNFGGDHKGAVALVGMVLKVILVLGLGRAVEA